jgi:hypothetical protein
MVEVGDGSVKSSTVPAPAKCGVREDQQATSGVEDKLGSLAIEIQVEKVEEDEMATRRLERRPSLRIFNPVCVLDSLILINLYITP